jgi:uncharacterized protein (TIGR02722 family)
MYKTRIIPVLTLVLVFSACTSQVTREDADTQTDYSGYWNDTDVRIVCEKFINSCLMSPRVTQIVAQKGRLPVILVGSFKNDSDEHIATSIITDTMEIAIFNSGKADFVAGGAVRNELREERQDQLNNASEESAKSIAKELGADFLLTGSVKTIVDQGRGTAARTYFVRAELTDIETNARLWMENSEIKKVIKRSAVKF